MPAGAFGIALTIAVFNTVEPAWSAPTIHFTTVQTPAEIDRIRVNEGKAVLLDKDGNHWLITGRDGNPELSPLAPRSPLASRPTVGLPENSLPDGDITTSIDGNRQAWLTGPTRRYDHAVLGDDIEASGFRVAHGDDSKSDYQLSTQHVFEDRRVRFMDLDDDGREELVAIKSGFGGGARIAAYTTGPDGITAFAESAAIGQGYRWLNIVSAADFDGDGKTEIAAVITPHLGAILRLFRLSAGQLLPVAEARGFSNHGIGMRTMQLSATHDVNGDGIVDLILPDAARTTIRIVTLAGGKFGELYRIALPAGISGDMVSLKSDTGVRIIFPVSGHGVGIISLNTR